MHLRTTLAVGAALLAAPLAVASSASAQTTGSVTLNLTSPVTVTGTAAAPGLTCTVKGSTYTVKVSRTTVSGYQVSGNATIVGYKGPGSYNATLSFTATGDGQNLVLGGRKVPVTINDAGGSASFSKTASGTRVPKAAGTTAAGTIAWTCPTA